MERKEKIRDIADCFAMDFKRCCERENMDVPELPEETVKKIITNYLEKKTLSEANTYFYKVFDEYVKGSYDAIDKTLDREEQKKTPEYRAWVRCLDINDLWYEMKRSNSLELMWVEVNGKAHTEDEAVKIAAEKWCELLFNWHLQDNGALNESHGGGFPACALATILGEKCREDITEEMKEKAYNLIREYYKKDIEFVNYPRMNSGLDGCLNVRRRGG